MATKTKIAASVGAVGAIAALVIGLSTIKPPAKPVVVFPDGGRIEAETIHGAASIIEDRDRCRPPLEWCAPLNRCVEVCE